jgi:hypothetical protein
MMFKSFDRLAMDASELAQLLVGEIVGEACGP